MSDPSPRLDILASDPLVHAAMELRPELDLVEASLLSGTAWRISFCSPDCRCVEDRAVAEGLQENLRRLRLRSSAIPASNLHRPPERRRVESALAKGAPVLLISPERFQRLSAIPGELPDDAEVHILSRSGGPQGRRRHRDLDLLLEFAAWSLRPAVEDWCEGSMACGRAGHGLAAYDLWLATAPDPTFEERAGRWSTLRELTARWLLSRAGRQRTPYAVRLRRAGDWFLEEAHMLAELRSPDDLRHARDEATWATGALLEAALLEAGVSAQIRALLMESLETPLSGAALQEVLYLARAGRRALRVLAARRLAGGGGPQSVATLQQLLWEDYPPLTDTALWSLGRIDVGICSRVVLSIARGRLQDDPSALRPSLLCAARQSDGFDALKEELLKPEILPLLRRETRQCIGGM